MIDTQENTSIFAILITFQTDSTKQAEAQYHLEELINLCSTLDIESKAEFLIPLKEPQPRYYIGTGWAEEIAAQAELLNVDCVVFDDALSPSQQRNLEKLCECEVIDRQQIILDIFAQRAQTKEASLQVELARLSYNLPRLQKMWSHLSRQRGGAKGTRGEGETQLEADRRIIEARIRKLKKELKEVEKQRQVLRSQREKLPVPTAAIVGYTNAGKSSLHRRLTHSEILVANKLFATLDPTTSLCKLPSGQNILLTDTVGFIRKLPHNLVDAFKSTLEETARAHFIIHLVDSSSPEIQENIETTYQVLKEIDVQNSVGNAGRGASRGKNSAGGRSASASRGDSAPAKKTARMLASAPAQKSEILVFNKCDKISADRLAALQERFPQAHFISIKNGEGLEKLYAGLEELLQNTLSNVRITLPQNRGDIVSRAYEEGQVVSTEYTNEGIVMQAYLPPKLLRSMQSKNLLASIEFLD